MLRLVVFDLDGTLVDSRRDLAESANAVLAEFGCGPLSEEQVGRMVGDGAATLITRAFAAAGCPRPPDALERFLAIYNARLLKFTRPYPGIEDVLGNLVSGFTLAVLTNKPLGSTRQVLEGLGLAKYFPAERVLGGDGPLPRKPDPSGLQHLMRAAGADPNDTILIGDSLIDLRTARAAHTRICLARYGFGFDGFPMDEIRPEDRLIDRPSDLLSAL
jgi:phosphoglycolate phosphatase